MIERRRPITRSMRSGAPGRSPQTPAAPCGSGPDTGSVFTFHGHRLASLYRTAMMPGMSFIFPKIRKIPTPVAGGAIAYLEKDEARRRQEARR